MIPIGYSVIDTANNEIQYFGNTIGQDVGFPNFLVGLPGNISIHSPMLNTQYGDFKLVRRYANTDISMVDFIETSNVTSDGDKVVIEYTYRNPTSTELINYSAKKRYEKEINGITIELANTQYEIASDRQSQSMITGIITLMSVQPNATINFKTKNSFISGANVSTMIGIALSVAVHVQTCFTIESMVSDAIANNNITSFTEIDYYYQ